MARAEPVVPDAREGACPSGKARFSRCADVGGVASIPGPADSLKPVPAVVGLLDPDDDRQPPFVPALPALPVQDVLLQQADEGLHRGVVGALTGSSGVGDPRWLSGLSAGSEAGSAFESPECFLVASDVLGDGFEGCVKRRPLPRCLSARPATPRRRRHRRPAPSGEPAAGQAGGPSLSPVRGQAGPGAGVIRERVAQDWPAGAKVCTRLSHSPQCTALLCCRSLLLLTFSLLKG